MAKNRTHNRIVQHRCIRCAEPIEQQAHAWGNHWHGRLYRCASCAQMIHYTAMRRQQQKNPCQRAPEVLNA